MKIKHLSIIGLFAFGAFACSTETKEETTTDTTEEVVAESINYSANTNESTVNWKGQVVGGMYFHTGILKLSEGSFTTENGKITSGNFTIDWNTMATTDSNYSEEHPAEHLIGHLKNADFFAVDSLGDASFEITGMEGTDVTGKLTIRGITNDEKITDVTINNENGTVTATGNLTFDRQKYDVSFAMSAKDMVLSDDIETQITLIGNENK